MTQEELTIENIGQDLDDLMNLDPRGYGVCRILYKASREYMKEPLTTKCAKALIDTVQEGDVVYILTGFVLLPFKKAEMDGIVSAMFLARCLVKAFGAKPVIICPEDNMEAVHKLSEVMGLHLYDSIQEILDMPISMAAIPFTKDPVKAKQQAEEIIVAAKPATVVSIEAPGPNEKGVYHNATGLDVTEIEAKTDVLFQILRNMGVLNIAIGDLGNEIGMGTIREHIQRYVPYAEPGGCQCGCGGGIATSSEADYILTATTSDWGCYGMMAAIAFLKGDVDIFQNPDLQEYAMKESAKAGMIDMYGWMIPAIDGFGIEINRSIVSMMRECISYALKLKETCRHHFVRVLNKHFYDMPEDTTDVPTDMTA